MTNRSNSTTSARYGSSVDRNRPVSFDAAAYRWDFLGGPLATKLRRTDD